MNLNCSELDVALKYGAVDFFDGSRVLIINSRWHTDFVEENFVNKQQLIHYQPLIQEHQRLVDSGGQVVLDLCDLDCSKILIIGDRNKKVNKGYFAKAFDLLSVAQGQVLVSCANEHGAKSLQKAFEELFVLQGVASKAHCRVFWGLPRKSVDPEILSDWRQLQEPFLIQNTDLWSCWGGFAGQEVDQGSQLLVSALPRLEGEGADLGAGYGYLSAYVLKHNQVNRIHLIEADYRSLNCARRNLESSPVDFYWRDVTRTSQLSSELPALDWVIMNPPFHQQNKQSLELGVAFFKTAREILKPGGRLFWVSNQHLPYLQALGRDRSQCKILNQTNRYLVGVYQREK